MSNVDLMKFLDGLDEGLGFGGDEVPVGTMPFVRFLDAMSDECKEGKQKPNTLLDSLTGKAFDLPVLINPLYMEVQWVEWPEDDQGNQIFGRDPVFQSRSYEEALAHFPKDDRGRSKEYFYRKYVVLAHMAGVDEPRIFQFRKSSAKAAERMQSAAKTITLPGADERRAPLLTQWWKLDVEDAISKKTGSAYKRLTLAFEEVETTMKFIERNAEIVKAFTNDGGFVLPAPKEEQKSLGE